MKIRQIHQETNLSLEPAYKLRFLFNQLHETLIANERILIRLTYLRLAEPLNVKKSNELLNQLFIGRAENGAIHYHVIKCLKNFKNRFEDGNISEVTESLNAKFNNVNSLRVKLAHLEPDDETRISLTNAEALEEIFEAIGFDDDTIIGNRYCPTTGKKQKLIISRHDLVSSSIDLVSINKFVNAFNTMIQEDSYDISILYRALNLYQ